MRVLPLALLALMQRSSEVVKLSERLPSSAPLADALGDLIAAPLMAAMRCTGNGSYAMARLAERRRRAAQTHPRKRRRGAVR